MKQPHPTGPAAVDVTPLPNSAAGADASIDSATPPSNSDISWLSEPHLQHLFMQFPLPLAVLGRDGAIRLLNKCFVETFDASCLKSDDLQQILDDPDDHLRSPIPFLGQDSPSPIFARTIKVGEDTILAIENVGETAYAAELAELRERVMALEKLSSTDHLTGAWNRAYFDRIIQVERSRSVRYCHPAALILLDVDDFKRVNDTLGHAIGDQVLCELVAVISKSIRTSDMLFRWGGEEFVILAPSTSYASAGGLAETLRSRIEQHGIQTAGNITVSLGVAEHDSSESESEWFRRADRALYSAKNSGRNRVVVDPRGNSDRWTTDQGAALLRLHWHRNYNCGDATIDLEHRQLFELANALIDAAFTRGTNPQAFDSALDKLLVHIARHFAHEESILARHKYTQLDAHALAHKNLLDRARQLRAAAAAGGGVTIGELVDFLADEVVARHMLKADRAFYPLFKKMRSSS